MGIFSEKRTTTLAVFTIMAGLMLMDAANSKIAYKKPINNKLTDNSLKEKHLGVKTEATSVEDLAATTTMTGDGESMQLLPFDEITAEAAADMDNITNEPANLGRNEEAYKDQTVTNSNDDFETSQIAAPEDFGMQQPQQLDTELTTTTVMSTTKVLTTPATTKPLTTTAARRASTTRTTEKTTTTTTPTTTTTTTTERNTLPCTCGIFMTSQIRRNTSDQPQGKPVIVTEVTDRTYPCNAIGQKQCQTKCLETIVQHLPNSANILCATLDRDCRKERAYLFIKNCRNHWWNTNLAAGREYCCKNGQPYICPLV